MSRLSAEARATLQAELLLLSMAAARNLTPITISTEPHREPSLSTFTDEEIAREYGWRVLRRMGGS